MLQPRTRSANNIEKVCGYLNWTLKTNKHQALGPTGAPNQEPQRKNRAHKMTLLSLMWPSVRKAQEALQ